MKANLFTKLSSALPRKTSKITIDDLATNIPKRYNAINAFGKECAKDMFIQEAVKDTLTKPNIFQKIAQMFKK
ncbi:MAG: hypothetical protein E7Z88_04620 [Cyanobacteria bacterium SIG27]|nr:hypothetical protein [Cyanobacteria bacterium SIG27]